MELQAGRFAARNRLQPADREDAIQEAHLAALQAMPKHDPARGEIGPFVNACIENRLRVWNHKRKLVRTCYQYRRRRQPKQVEIDLNTLPARESLDAEPLSELRRLIRLLPRLHLTDRVLLVHLLAGETHAAIAGLLRVSRQRVGQLQTGLLDRLRGLLAA